MSLKAYQKIYQATQELAAANSAQDGWEAKPDVFHSQHKDMRVRNQFTKACGEMQYHHGHEMADIVEEVEQANVDSNTAAPASEQVKVDEWKAQAAMLIIKQCHFSLSDAIKFSHAAYESINGDIDVVPPQDCVDSEIDAMRACS